MRNFSSALLNSSKDTYLRLLTFVKLEFDSGTIYVHNGIGTYNWDSTDWLGLGEFGSINGVKEGYEVSPYALELTLSGLSTDMMDEVQNQNYYLRPVTIYLGSLNSSYALEDDPDELWSGYMDVAHISLGKNNAIRLRCESNMIVFEKANSSRFTDADLQKKYSGDLFLQYLEEMQEANVIWGGNNVSSQVRTTTQAEIFEEYDIDY